MHPSYHNFRNLSTPYNKIQQHTTPYNKIRQPRRSPHSPAGRHRTTYAPPPAQHRARAAPDPRRLRHPCKSKTPLQISSTNYTPAITAGANTPNPHATPATAAQISASPLTQPIRTARAKRSHGEAQSARRKAQCATPKCHVERRENKCGGGGA